MYKVELMVGIYLRSNYGAGETLFFSKTIVLPFHPFPGLMLEVEEEITNPVIIKDVTYNLLSQTFHCTEESDTREIHWEDETVKQYVEHGYTHCKCNGEPL